MMGRGGAKNYQHGHTAGGRVSPTYHSWAAMLHRCTEVGHRAAYGERGISVCDRWRHFESFLADLGERPTLAHTLSRYLDSGNYEPGNVEWATLAEQKAQHYGKRAMRRLHEFHIQEMLHTLQDRVGYPVEGSDAY